MKKLLWLVVGLFLISRFLFLANYPHFYDSPEYLRESVAKDFFTSLTSSHESVHPLYLFLSQKFQQLAILLTGENQTRAVSLISAVFGAIGFFAFYLLIKRLFGGKIAIISLVPIIFFPHAWLIQTNILHESLDHGLFLLGLLFWDIFLEIRRPILFFFALLVFSLAIFNFMGILIWFTTVIGLAILRSQKENLFKNISLGIVIILGSFILATFGLYQILSLALPDATLRLKTLVLGYGEGGLFSDWNFLAILRTMRNDLLILVNGYTIAVILGGAVGLVYLIKEKKYKVIIFILASIIPFLITGKFWYGGLYGRYSALVAYPLALLFGSISSKKLYWLTISLLTLSFFPTFFTYQQTPIPEIQSTLINQSGMTNKDLLILSDYQRPQLIYPNVLYLNGEQEKQKEIEEKIEKALVNKTRVLISQQAIDFPYYQYDGQQIHIISKGDKNKAQLRKILKNKKLTLVAKNKNYPSLSLYLIE